MLAFVLSFVIAIVVGVGGGISDAPGLHDSPLLPPPAEQHSNAQDAITDSGRPDVLPAGNAQSTATDEENGTNGHPVDTSGAPEEIDLTGVPANDNASVPDTVGANDNADLPDQAGGDVDLPDQAVEGSARGDCASSAKGKGAADC